VAYERVKPTYPVTAKEHSVYKLFCLYMKETSMEVNTKESVAQS